MTSMAFKGGRLEGRTSPPPSKSHTHRAFFLASMADGTSHVSNALMSADTKATLAACVAMGAKASEKDGVWTIEGGDLHAPGHVNAENSGTTMRIFAGISSMFDGETVIDGDDSLRKRPMGPLLQALESTGARCSSNGGLPPVSIRGPNRGGRVSIGGDVSSQFITGLLFSLPLLPEDSRIEILPPFQSRGYVDLTLDAMQQFGVKVSARARKNGSMMYRVAAPQRYVASDFAVEGDYSQAAFLAVLGCVIGGITITGLNPDSQQGDKVILDILKRCGGKFKPVEGGYHFDRSLLKATEIDLADCPDLGPILFTLGCFCSGETVIRNAGRLRLKESDRIDAMRDELQKMGARIDVEGDSVHIQGVALHAPNAPLSGHNDHRIVMALAVAAIASGLPALLCGAEAVEKSWPAFWNVLRSLGAKIELSSDRKEDFDIKA